MISLFSLVILFLAFIFFKFPLPIQLIHITIPYLLKNGLVLYRDIVYHHTPLLQFILLGFYNIFGFSFFSYRVYFFLVVVLTAFFIFLSANLFSKKVSISTLIVFILGYFAFFSDSQLEEVTVALFSIASFYFLLKFLKNQNIYNLIFSGFFIGLSILTKQGTAIVVPVVLAYLVFRKHVFYSLISYVGGLILVLLPVALYFFINHSFNDFFYWNIIFNFTIYSKEAPVAPIFEPAKVTLTFLLYALPLAFLLNKKGISNFERESFIVLSIVSFALIFTLLPSFYINRLRAIFCLTALGYGLILAKFFVIIKRKNFKISPFFSSTFLVLTLFLLVGQDYFLSSFDYYFKRLSNKPYNMIDYNTDDIKAVMWIKKNTKEDERIMNLGNHYILFLSNRLPANKYLWPIPWLLKPYDASTREIMDNPPRIVIDGKLNHVDYPQIPSLNAWPFYNYLYKNYKLVAEFGDVLIYQKDTDTF